MRNLKKVLSVLLVVAIMATAMVPAFAAETFTYETQAKALYDVGLFKGVSATEFVPDLGSKLTREQGFALVVRLLGKEADSKALTAADVDAALAAYGDAKEIDASLKNYVAFAVKNNLVQGDGKLVNPKGALLGKDLATVLLRNLGYEVTAAGYETATADLSAKGGLTADEAKKFASKELIRDDLVGIAYGSLKATYKTGETVIAKLVASKVVDEAKAIAAGILPKAVGAMTAKVTGAKKFTLTFDSAVDSTKVTAASVTVKKGASTYNVESFVLAADKKSAVVTIGNSIVKGDYEISVTGLADAAVTAKVTAENERLEKVEFTSENAVLDSLTVFTKVNVNFKVLNQYGEDVTSKKGSLIAFTSGKGSVDTTKVSDGVISLNTATGSEYTVNEKVTVSATYVDTDNNKTVFASSVLTVSQMAQVGEITITDLYNANKDTLDVDATFADFKLLVEAKDQYGNKVPYGSLAGALLMQSTDNSLVQLNGSFEQVTIDGEKKTALSLQNGTSAATVDGQKAGTANVMLVSKFSGKTAQYTVTVKDSQKIDTLTLQTPDYPVAGEKVKIPFTAIDKDGNEITKLSGLWMKGSSSDTHSLSVTGGTATAVFENDAVSGKPVLTLDATALTDKTTLYITGTTSTYKFVNFTLTLQKPATLESVSGFSSDMYVNILKGAASTDFNYENVKVKDSYGRDVTKDQLYDKYVLGTNYKFTIASSDPSRVMFGASTVSGTVYDITLDRTTTPGTITSVYPTVTAVAKGSTTATLTLWKWDTKGTTTTTDDAWVSVSDTSFSVNTVEKKDIQSYTASNIAKVYTNANYYGAGKNEKEVKVEGVLASGKKVLIPRVLGSTQNYYVTTTGDLAYDSAVSTVSGKVYSTATLADDADKDTSATYTVTVMGYSKTENIAVATKVSGVKPSADKMALYATTDKYKTAGYTSYTKESDNVASISLAQLAAIDSTNTNCTASDVRAIAPNLVKFTDQYGVTMAGAPLTAYAPVANVIVSDVKDTNNTIVDGANDSTVYTAGYSVYVTVVTTDGKVFGFTLAIK